MKAELLRKLRKKFEIQSRNGEYRFRDRIFEDGRWQYFFTIWTRDVDAILREQRNAILKGAKSNHNTFMFLIKWLVGYLSIWFSGVKEAMVYNWKYLSYTRAKNLAKRRFKVDNKTYYVIEGEGATFFVGNVNEIAKLRKIRVFEKNLDAKRLNEICCFRIGATCPLGNDHYQRLTFAK
jgi:hypothetical protein